MVRRQARFRKPDFQERLAQARRFRRKPAGTQKTHSRTKGAIVVIVIVVFVYFLSISQLFLIKEVTVNSAGPSVEQIEDVLVRMQQKKVAHLIPANHFFILSEKSLLSAIQDELPDVKKIESFRRILPDRLELILKTREPRYVWQSGEDFFLMDQDSVIFQEIQNYQPETYSQLLITDTIARPVRVGEDVGAAKAVGFIEKIREIWQHQIPETSFLSFSLPSVQSPDIFVQTLAGYQVYLDLNRDAAVQLENLRLLLSNQIPPDTVSGLSYIDLRLADIAYYCYKDAPCALESRQAQEEPGTEL